MAHVVIVQRIKDELAFFAVFGQAHVAQKPQMMRGVGDGAADDGCDVTDAQFVFHGQNMNDFRPGVVGERLENFRYPFGFCSVRLQATDFFFVIALNLTDVVHRKNHLLLTSMSYYYRHSREKRKGILQSRLARMRTGHITPTIRLIFRGRSS